jgi:hypothetical protein
MTALAIVSNTQAINPGDVPGLLTREAATGQHTDPDLLRKFGPRYVILPPIITSEAGTKNLLNTMADGLLRRMNHNLENLELRLNCRPDLQMGRTIYFAERRKLYYITSIQQHYTQGEPLETTLTGQYGHLATDPIGDPISIAINTPTFAAVEVKFPVVDKVTAAEDQQNTMDNMS